MNSQLFSSTHVLEALRCTQEEDIKVAPNAPVFLAAVLEHVTHHVLRIAGEKTTKDWDSEKRKRESADQSLGGKRIRKHHLEDSFVSDSELRSLATEVESSKSQIFISSTEGTKNSLLKVKLDAPSGILPFEDSGRLDQGTSNQSTPSFENGDRYLSQSRDDKLAPTALFSGLLICTMGLPGSQKAAIMNGLKTYIDNLTKKKLSVHIKKTMRNENLFQAKLKSPKEISFAWHTYVLTSCIKTVEECCDMHTFERNLLYITDSCPIECFSQTLADFSVGNLTKNQLEAYHNFFLDSIEVSKSCHMNVGKNNISRGVIILYIARNPVVCRRNILQTKNNSIQNADCIKQLESIYSRHLEVLSQQCAYKRNVLVVSQRMLLDYKTIYNKLADARSGKINLPVVTFKDCITIQNFNSEIHCKKKPWLHPSQMVVYNSDEMIFESYNDLCKGQWIYGDTNANGEIEPIYDCETVYVYKQYWIIRSLYMVDVIFEHMSRGQNIVVYSRV